VRLSEKFPAAVVIIITTQTTPFNLAFIIIVNPAPKLPSVASYQ
jgi:hypothetical protein